MVKPIIRVKTGLFYLLFGTTLISIMVSNFVWIRTTILDFQEEKRQLRQNAMERQEMFVRTKVKEVLHYIEHRRNNPGRHTKKEIQEQVLDYLSSIRFGSGGYVFVNQYDGQPLIFDGKRVYEKRSIKNMTDPSGLRIFDLEMEQAHKAQGGFMHYSFKKMDGEVPVPKISYIHGLPEWQWIIGAGDYLDTAEKEIQAAKATMISDLNTDVARTIMTLLLFTAFLAFLSSIVSSRMDKQFSLLDAFFQSSAYEYKSLDLSRLRIKELRDIGAQANKMLQKRQNIENELFAIQENLKNKTTLLNNVLQSAPSIAIITTDLDFEVTYVNSQAEELFNKKADSFTGSSMIQLRLHKSLTPSFFEQLANHLEQEQAFSTLIKKTRKSAAMFIDMTVSGIYNIEGDLTGYLFFCRDVTEPKKAEEELEKHRLHLEQLVKERTLELEQLNQELRDKNEDLEHFNDLFVGREFRIKELRNKVKELEAKLAQRTH